MSVFQENGKNYLVILSQNGVLHVIDKDLNEKQGFPALEPTLLNTYSLPLSGDFDSDNKYEIALLRGDGKFYIINTNGEVEAQKHIGTGRFTSISACDFDRDGFFEISFIKDDSLILLNHNGSYVNEFPFRIKRDTLISPYLVPLTFIVNNKVSISYADSLKLSHIYEDMTQNPYFPLHFANNGTGNAILTDANSDNRYEIAIFSTTGELHVFNTMIDSAIFPKTGYDNQNTSWIRFHLTPGSRQEKQRVYIYPSIVKSSNATLRVFMENSGYLKAEIWTFSGIKLRADKFYVTGGEYNEFNMNFGGIGSGVYILRWEFPVKRGYFKFSVVK